ncbi:hypothetical protein VNO77_33888 [Canavalia gladiata]|uniref:Uncharacterized protein n=1 Tax=Canavalia gladiata TaxID=3824 RepID=A0AAN9PYS5_CANGL
MGHQLLNSRPLIGPIRATPQPRADQQRGGLHFPVLRSSKNTLPSSRVDPYTVSIGVDRIGSIGGNFSLSESRKQGDI